MKKLFLFALLGSFAVSARSQTTVYIVSDLSGYDKDPHCLGTYDYQIDFTLIDPSDCDHPKVVTVYEPGSTGFGGLYYTSSGLGYPGYNIVSAKVYTPLYPLTVGDYTAPLPCSLTPFDSFETTCCDAHCQYGVQWVYPTSIPGTAYLYLT